MFHKVPQGNFGKKISKIASTRFHKVPHIAFFNFPKKLQNQFSHFLHDWAYRGRVDILSVDCPCYPAHIPVYSGPCTLVATSLALVVPKVLDPYLSRAPDTLGTPVAQPPRTPWAPPWPNADGWGTDIFWISAMVVPEVSGRSAMVVPKVPPPYLTVSAT